MAIDQGTTGSTVLVFDRRGRIAGRSYSSSASTIREPGWVEHDARRIWGSRSRCPPGDTEGEVQATALRRYRITNRARPRWWGSSYRQPIHAPSCGRSATAGTCAQLRKRAPRRKCAPRPTLSTRISPPPKVPGYSTTCVAPRARAAGDLAFGTIDSGSSGSSRRRRTHVTDRTTPRGPALQHPRPRLGSQSAPAFDVPMAMVPEVRPSRRRHRRDRAATLRGAGLIAGHRRGSAGRPLRSGVLRARHGEEHLRHRLFLLMQTGSKASPRSAGW